MPRILLMNFVLSQAVICIENSALASAVTVPALSMGLEDNYCCEFGYDFKISVNIDLSSIRELASYTPIDDYNYTGCDSAVCDKMHLRSKWFMPDLISMGYLSGLDNLPTDIIRAMSEWFDGELSRPDSADNGITDKSINYSEDSPSHNGKHNLNPNQPVGLGTGISSDMMKGISTSNSWDFAHEDIESKDTSILDRTSYKTTIYFSSSDAASATADHILPHLQHNERRNQDLGATQNSTIHQHPSLHYSAPSWQPNLGLLVEDDGEESKDGKENALIFKVASRSTKWKLRALKYNSEIISNVDGSGSASTCEGDRWDSGELGNEIWEMRDNTIREDDDVLARLEKYLNEVEEDMIAKEIAGAGLMERL